MSLLTVLLWCLHPLAPARRLYELTRHTLQLTVRQLSDQRTIDWLCDDPDNPRTFARFETWIANLSAGVDTLIYLRARELLGLPNHDWIRPLEAQPQRRKSRSFAELWLSLERCILKFGDIERLAARRAIKLKRLLPEWSGATTTEQQQSRSPHEALILRTHPAKPCAWTRRTRAASGQAVRAMILMIAVIAV